MWVVKVKYSVLYLHSVNPLSFLWHISYFSLNKSTLPSHAIGYEVVVVIIVQLFDEKRQLFTKCKTESNTHYNGRMLILRIRPLSWLLLWLNFLSGKEFNMKIYLQLFVCKRTLSFEHVKGLIIRWDKWKTDNISFCTPYGGIPITVSDTR